MTTDQEKAANGEPSVEPAATAPRAPSAHPPATSEAEPSAEQKLTEALAEGARLRDQLLRTAADFDNYRKRSRRAEDDAQKRGREQMLKDLLPVFDNLERAVQHAEAAPDAEAVVAGLRMVLKQFSDTLEKASIKRIATVGLPFDPTRHEAISQVASAEHSPGVVVAEVQPGYTMGDTLVRAALVVVSNGSPSASSPSA
jgi:molecular chaperone GrpE